MQNANYYIIVRNFKYNAIISTFSHHITIFRTLSTDIRQLNVNERQTNKTNKRHNFFLQSFQNFQTFLPHPFEIKSCFA